MGETNKVEFTRDMLERMVRAAVERALPTGPKAPTDEYSLRLQMCELGRRMYDRGFVAANDGNLCCRLGEGRFLCTPTGVSKGFMKPEMLCVVDEQGNQLSGDWPRTSEVLLHLAIMREVPHIHAVAHAHAPNAVAFAVTGTEIPQGIMPEVEALLGPVPIAPFELPGTDALAESVVPFVKNHANTILLSNHGVVGCDQTLEQAYWHIETLDSYCKIILQARQLGELKPLSDQAIAGLLEWKKANCINDPRLPAGAVELSSEIPPVEPATSPLGQTITKDILSALYEELGL